MHPHVAAQERIEVLRPRVTQLKANLPRLISPPASPANFFFEFDDELSDTLFFFKSTRGRAMSLARPVFPSTLSTRLLPLPPQSSCLRTVYYYHSPCSRVSGNRRNFAHATKTGELWRQQNRTFGVRVLGQLKFIKVRRTFATTPAVSHGHIDPPKPGEEYVRLSLNISSVEETAIWSC